ncbi:bifunctional [glutamine synthetase] adenylyltransferase/[glutamine synthetase]-adenylyl-L-tyrosine phosphorylase [Modestobacter sp. I12A-02628]|uniref:Bifunctional glutamine synthetase adenylyltransferase/adenylyl-removing enzyme n=1 Tax=Goekera deserti TaxID=2497753 RepID=A0A7K3WDE9_9ACTN|nr:bifunctional [glutamine synthetase] adenylyltransferase/[glutamine synthetase]-adenylyl-L-tyrosine phosphorylase [Goekera deserti]MPQ97611.1 bifunctional [glutamine synthetase] adenylyltransferase/[glutamine synthetase]-adenylyl-L-tyrosine phosphorylase [Goekera deserti]NDI47785.1 bifunctional [glutamine synthetase] adenylyltransferase/[glutamine synthetase]-adenylyl-L-tyrosine phosphorylase [Goekera deserti]NEL53533.1 bifunctional [glutamine synthetase] adenylyltransferase/[glutamine synthet
MVDLQDVPRGAVVRLARLGFEDGARAARLLSDPAVGLWDLASNGPADPEAAPVVSAMARAGDPDLAALSLWRLVEALDVADPAGGSAAALLARLRGSAPLRGRLLSVLGASSGFGDHLAGHPGDWTVLDDDGRGPSRPTPLSLERQMLVAVGADPDDPPWGVKLGRAAPDASPERVRALRLAYHRAVLSLAGRDLADDGLPTEDVAGELADLAGAVLTAALAIAVAEQPADAAACRLAVIGLGKCGGRELNYVSDVDVVFVAEAVDPHDEEGAALTSATRVAAALMRICREAAWEVDAALRPEGKAGPLVRTVAGHEAYYHQWASTWEFQALLKMRPVAGDPALGAAYVDALWPLVWKAGDRPGFVPDVQAMRRRVEENIPAAQAGRELKLGPGGLRDVEFSVQLLQLVHGRVDPTLRTGGTIPALDALSAGGYVGRDDAATLLASYRFLRTVEHRLQLLRLRRTHLLPTDETQLRWLARALGYRPDHRGQATDVLAAELALHTREVRRIHQKLFYRPLLAAVARVPGEQLQLGPKAAGEWLRALGFADPDGALRHLAALTGGLSRSASMQRYLLPVLLQTFAGCADPDAGLLAYRQVSEALGGHHWYLRLLRDEGQVAERLAQLLGSSQYVAGLLTRTPEALRILADDAQLEPRSVTALSSAWRQAVARAAEPTEGIAVLRALRRQELLRVACADLLGRLDVVRVGRALRDIAVATLQAGLDAAVRAWAEGAKTSAAAVPVDVAVIAMGRLGGSEMSYGSDADVLFVHRARPGHTEAEASHAATTIAHTLRRLLGAPAPDPAFEVDANLRPEGRNGALSRSLSAFAEYYERWVAVWEVQALLRAEPVAGDAELGRAFTELIDPIRHPDGGLSADQVAEIRRIKARVESERLPRGADPATHTKLGRGGLADVEWTVQLLQLQHAHAQPALRVTPTVDALVALAGCHLLDDEQRNALQSAWEFASQARNAAFLVRGRPSDQLPRQGLELAAVARACGYGPEIQPGQFLDDYRRTTRRARGVVEQLFYDRPVSDA